MKTWNVIQDAISTNARENICRCKINSTTFSDWEETGELKDNLKFASSNDIEFKQGDGRKRFFQHSDGTPLHRLQKF